jgi:urease accessory protein UreE
MVNVTATTEKPAKPAPSEPSEPSDDERIGDICILDMGEHNRRRVKRLRRGKGKLMSKVERAIEELQEGGVLSPSAQTVIVIVREELSLSSIFDNDDDDDDDDY